MYDTEAFRAGTFRVSCGVCRRLSALRDGSVGRYAPSLAVRGHVDERTGGQRGVNRPLGVGRQGVVRRRAAPTTQQRVAYELLIGSSQHNAGVRPIPQRALHEGWTFVLDARSS